MTEPIFLLLMVLFIGYPSLWRDSLRFSTSKMVELKKWKHSSLPCSWSWRKSFQSFTIEYDVYCGFFIYGFYHTKVVSLFAHFVECYHEGVLNFVKNFFCFNWDYGFVFFFWFILLMKCITLISSLMLNSQIMERPKLKIIWSPNIHWLMNG